jgi:hypothetical protein
MRPSYSSRSISFFTVGQTALLTLSLLTLSSVRASAQIDRGVLEGTVIDPSSGVVAGAKVRVANADTGFTQKRTTNSSGYYRFPGLAVGEYTLSVSNAGFKTQTLHNVVLLVGQTRTLDVSLQLGGIEEMIEVKIEAVPVERSSAESSAVIQDDQIGNLPVNGRNWATLTTLAPWAQDDGGGDQRTIRFAGRGRDDNNFQIDGVDSGGIQEQAQKSTTRLQISEDAIEEYRVNSALYDAEYGTQAGGQVNVVTKSGKNDFHGTVFGYFRNSVFDARNFTDFDVNGNPFLPPFRMGQYGMTLGGPIARDKTFFFVSYEGLRQLQQQTFVATVPDPTEQLRILSGHPEMCPILQQFPWRTSTGSIAACAPKFVFPDSQFVDGGPDSVNIDNNVDVFTNQLGTRIHEDTWLARIDHKFSDRTNLYFRAQRDVAISYSPLGNLLDQQAVFNHPANYLIALQHTFTASIFNEVKFGVNRSPFHNPQVSVFPLAVNTNDYEPLNNTNTDNEVGTTFSILDDLSITHGRHTFKAGVEFRRVRLNQGITADNSITYKDNASLEANAVDSIAYNTSWCCRKYRRFFILPYFQDEWKVRPNLTLNIGLRWEYYSVEKEADNNATVFDMQNCVTNFDPTNGPGFCPKGSPLYFPNYRNWDPRVSIAWAPKALHEKTVVRAGFGIYHGASQNDDLNAALESNNTRFNFASTDLTGTQVLAFGPGYLQNPPDFAANGGPSYSPITRTPRALFRKRRDLYVEQWGLSIDQQLPGQFLFSASYLGTHGVLLFKRNYENTCDFTQFQVDGTCIRPLDQTRAAANYSGVGSVDLKIDDGTSSYHGLRLGLARRASSGFSFQGSYTWSHSINDGSIGGGEANAPENASCVPCDRGPSVFDVRHGVEFSSYYELPFGMGKKYATEGVAGKVFGGWTLSDSWNWHTGHPITVLFGPGAGFLPDGNDSADQRPDIAPGVSLTPPGGSTAALWFNPLAFVPPPINPATGIFTRWGNAGRGLVRSPHV